MNNGHDEVSETLQFSSIYLWDNICACMCSNTNCANPNNARANQFSVKNASQTQVENIQHDLTQALCRAMSLTSLQPQSREASGVGDFILRRRVL